MNHDRCKWPMFRLDSNNSPVNVCRLFKHSAYVYSLDCVDFLFKIDIYIYIYNIVKLCGRIQDSSSKTIISQFFRKVFIYFQRELSKTSDNLDISMVSFSA